MHVRIAGFLLVFLFPLSALAAGTASTPTARPTLIDAESIFMSNNSARAKSAAAVDTFCLYGGSGTLEGKFQEASGIVPDWQGWTSVDLTETPVYWQLSTFCASNLDGDGSSGGAGDGPGNIAYWAGQTAEQQPLWVGGAGYGNSWNAILEWRATVDESSGPVAQTVGLTFAFNADTEPGYDFFWVEYDSANVQRIVTGVEGWNTNPQPPGTQFPADVFVAHPFQYNGGDYSGPNNDEIVLRFRVTSDGAWSDQDGFADSECGAAQVDDITVTYNDGNGQQVNFSDFDVVNGGWEPAVSPYFGDFALVHPFLADSDPCTENPTPGIAFVDDGHCPRNPSNNFGEEPCESTGGEVSSTYSYWPGGYVVNISGGISGIQSIRNEVWSPVIAWDLPGTQDDGNDVVGAKFRYDQWTDGGSLYGITQTWRVRFQQFQGSPWSTWKSRNFIYAVPSPAQWSTREIDITDLVPSYNFANIQLALGVNDVSSIFAFPSNSTPAPYYDNVAISKYQVGGPNITISSSFLFQDSFPQSGETDFSTLVGRQNADIRLDVSQDLAPFGGTIDSGDSCVATIAAVMPGTSLAAAGLNWALDVNPLFDDVRDNVPVGATLVPGGAANGWDQYRGTVAGENPDVGNGPLEETFFFDAPDAGFFHPGDEFRYYVWGTDNGGRRTTLPVDISGWTTGQQFDPEFVVRGLPSTQGSPGSLTTPSTLVVFDARTQGLVAVSRAFAENGWQEGSAYDTYFVHAATGGRPNGIGSSGAHGATSDQLGAYENILVFTEHEFTNLLSDGSGVGGNNKGDDLGVLTSWFGQSRDRHLAVFGDRVSRIEVDSPGAGATFLTSVLGVGAVDNVVGIDVEGQEQPRVESSGALACFQTPFHASIGCLTQATLLDSIEPLAGALQGHAFLDLGGLPYGGPGRAGSVIWDRPEGGFRKFAATFPFALSGLTTPSENSIPSGLTVRSELLRELLVDCIQAPLVSVPTPVVPTNRAYLAARNAPDPFNPTTVFHLTLGRTSHTEARIYNMRGELVHTLHVGVLEAGVHQLPWDGRDDNGAAVASGVYALKAVSDGLSVTEKAVLLK